MKMALELQSNFSCSDGATLKGAAQVHTASLPESLRDLLSEDICRVLTRSSDPLHNTQDCSITVSCITTNTGHSFPNATDANMNTTTQTHLHTNSDSFPDAAASPLGVFSNQTGVRCIPMMQIVTVVSEARLIEVFTGPHTQYLGSFACDEVIEELPDTLICKTVIQLPRPQIVLKLVLKNTFDPCSVMLYGIHARIIEEHQEITGSSGGTFSSSNLNTLLSDHGVKLSKQADTFKRFLESYNDGSAPLPAGGMALPLLQNFMRQSALGSPNVNSLLNNLTEAAGVSNNKNLLNSLCSANYNNVHICNSNNGILSNSTPSMASNEKLSNSQSKESSRQDADLQTALQVNGVALIDKMHTVSDISGIEGAAAALSKIDISPACTEGKTMTPGISQLLGNGGNVKCDHCQGQSFAAIEQIIDSKIRCFEQRIEQIIEQKISKQTALILNKLEALHTPPI